jgi:hypothetical protein
MNRMKERAMRWVSAILLILAADLGDEIARARRRL